MPSQARQMALRFGLVDVVAQTNGTDLIALPACMRQRLRKWRCTAISAMRTAPPGAPFALLQDSLHALFGIEHACLFAPLPTAPCD